MLGISARTIQYRLREYSGAPRTGKFDDDDDGGGPQGGTAS